MNLPGVYLRDYLRVLKRLIFPSGRETPLQVILFITSRCNARCGHCFYWRELDRGKDLTLGEIKKISDSLGKIFSLSISGGEPFLSPLLAETCVLFCNNNRIKRLQIPTNGLLPGKIAETAESILRQCPSELTVALSIDGLEETHNRLRGREDCFRKLRETYERLAGLKKEYPRFRLVANTVISNQNAGEIGRLYEWMRENWPELDAVNWDWLRGSIPSPEIGLPAPDERRELKQAILAAQRDFLRGKNGRWHTLIETAVRDYLYDINLKTIEERRQVIPCLADRTGLVIYASGDCSFCEMLPALGNIRQASLKEIISSPAAKSMRRSIRAGKCFCTHGCNQPYNAIFNPKNYFGIMRRAIRHLGILFRRPATS